jgi:hypothetical protein
MNDLKWVIGMGDRFSGGPMNLVKQTDVSFPLQTAADVTRDTDRNSARC